MEKARILVVEDEAIIAMDIANTLRNLGYEVTDTVPSGEQAIASVKENKPDMILMDIVLKGEMDGIQTAEQIRAQYSIPVIFLTAYADEKTLERAKKTGPFGYIMKPFEERDIRVAVEIGLYKAKAEFALRESEHRSGQKVLLVDDDKDLLRTLSVRLKADGYKVVFAADGISAISVARKEEPDIIILDLSLPGGGGFTVMERLRSLLPLAQIPIIVLTARDILGNKERSLNAGAQALLLKPVDNDVLLETIRKVLGNLPSSRHTKA